MYSGSTGYREKISRLINWGHWFAFGNILLCLLTAVKYLSNVPDDGDLLGQFYLYCSTLGHFAFLGFVVYLLTLFPLTLVLPNSAAIRVIGIVVATVGQTILLADAYLFGRYGFHVNLFFLDLFLEDGEFISASLKTWLVITGSIVLLLVIEVVMAQVIWHRLKNYRQRRIGFWVAGPLMVAFVISHLLHIWADAYHYEGITKRAFVLPFSNPTTAKTLLDSYGFLPEQADSQQIAKLDYPLVQLTCSAQEVPQSVVLIVADGLRYDAITSTDMPATFAFSLDSKSFTRHYSGGNQAKQGLFAMEFSIPARYREAALDDEMRPLLSHAFFTAGYPIGDFRTLPDQLARWETWYQEQAGSSYSLLHLGQPPASDDNTHLSRSQYRAYLKQLDGQIAAILEQVAFGPQASNTLVLVTGSYGYELGETEDAAGSGTNYSRWQVQVPLLIKWPGVEAGTISRQTSHYDIAPTVIKQALNCSSPLRGLTLGKPIMDPSPRERIVLGDVEQMAIVESDRTTVIDAQGDYSIRDRDYAEIPNARLRMPTVLKAIHDTKRFYAAPGK